MPNAENHEFLSFGDALFLYLEREGTPLNIASVSIFEGNIELEDLMAFVESKLPLIPRYLQRVVIPPLNIGAPSWEFDPYFDLENHVRQVSLKRGTEAELKDLAGRILSSTLDRSRPLWDMTLIKGLKGNKTGLISRAHHSMADGLSGVGLLNALMDTSPVSKFVRTPKREMHVPPPRDPFTLFADGLVGSCFSMVQRTLTAYSDIVRMAQRAVSTAEKQMETVANSSNGIPGIPTFGLEKLTKMIPEMAQPIERLPFNTLCHGPQKFRWVQIPLPAIKNIKNACGTTVNDVILTLVTAAFRDYVKLQGTNVKRRLLRIIVPVSVRDPEKANNMGNEITFIPLAAPLYISDPVELLNAVHERMEMLKTTRAPELAVFSGTLLGFIPSPLQAVLAPILSRLPISVCNVICTNVPGPQEPLYMLGHRMLSAYPYVPIGGEMGVNCAILTYDNMAFFGFTCDTYAAPEPARLEEFLIRAFEELESALGTRESRPPKPRKTAAKKRLAGTAHGKTSEKPRGRRNRQLLGQVETESKGVSVAAELQPMIA